MNFEDLKQKLQEQFDQLMGKIVESPSYQRLNEWYERLDDKKQKLVSVAAVALIGLALLSFPLTYYWASGDTISEVNSTRQLIQDLMQAKRDSGKLSSFAKPMALEVLKSQANGVLQGSGLQPKQLGAVGDFESPSGSMAIPKNILQRGVEVSLKQINVRQTVNIAERLMGLDASVRMAGLEIKASAEDSHLFDVAYRLVVFSLPEEATKPGAKPAPKKGAK